ncbi:MAG: hypothetical protein GY702_08120 [Desulfobulbaceae bacterium]|nr:hypothetical protein [Desulfobulbaceae bacterium]
MGRKAEWVGGTLIRKIVAGKILLYHCAAVELCLCAIRLIFEGPYDFVIAKAPKDFVDEILYIVSGLNLKCKDCEYVVFTGLILPTPHQ